MRLRYALPPRNPEKAQREGPFSKAKGYARYNEVARDG